MAKAAKTTAKKAPSTEKKTSSKKAGKEQLSVQKRLEILQHNINAKFKGRLTIQTGDEFSNVFILRRPTGITSLDIAIGGGFPAGGMTQIVGGDSVGKDYLVNRAIANLQTVYGDQATVALCMTEMSYDKKYAKKCGVRIALTPKEIKDWQKALGRAFTAEEMAWATDQVGTIHQVLGFNAEELLEGAAQCIESNLYHMVVINSFGALLTKAEEEAEGGIADKHYSGAAMPITQFMKRMHMALNHQDDDDNPNITTILGINQFRDNVGKDAKWNPLREGGGWALKHGKLVDIFLAARARIKISGSNSTQQIVVGKEIHWDILKGKAGCHDGPKGSYPFYFGECGYPFGADVYQDLITIAVQYNIIERAGAWMSYVGDGFDLRAQGKENLAHAIAGAPGAFDHLRSKCFEAANVHFITKN
jgi:recombination protein RecA